ncbi:MAG: trypsin-like peptidase domain-containing protein [Scytonema sp. RU_4_4]|nr:trypsin-like peptidase domain-containing protein [Scytonema sp. RU_4_4]
MNPESFLAQNDVASLIMALNHFAIKISSASERQDVLESAGIDTALLSNLKLDTKPSNFAAALVAAFRTYRISNQRRDYHPLVSLLKHLCELAPIYGISEYNIALFTRLVEQGEDNFKALAARSSVARIESPKGTAIGTGVLIQNNVLLTCYHVFSKSQVEQAWVRFNYAAGNYTFDSDVFKLDLNATKHSSQIDYTLVKVKGELQQQTATPTNTVLNSGQEIRLIHHPQGKQIVISEIGQIVQLGEDYIDHNISADYGSSGAPIFNRNWQLVAIHRGNLGIGRATHTIEQGVTSGVPLSAFWKDIETYFF